MARKSPGRSVTKTHSRPSGQQRQPVLGGAVQDAEVSPRVPGPIRQHRGRTRLLRRVLRLVQQPPLSLGARAAHAGDGASRRDLGSARATRRDPGRDLRRAPRALRAAGATTGRAATGSLDQPAEAGGRHRRSTVIRSGECLKLVDRFRFGGGVLRIK
jgi:hypothetical protein